MKKKMIILGIIFTYILNFAFFKPVKAESYAMGPETVIIEGVDEVKEASYNGGRSLTISDSNKDYGTMSLKIIGTSVILDNKIYYGIVVDAMSNAKGTVSSYNRYASKNMTISAKLQTLSSNTTGYNGLNEANFLKVFNMTYFNSYMSYDASNPASVLNKISNNSGLVIDDNSAGNTTTASYYYTFDGYSSNRSYPNCGEYHQIAMFFFETDNTELNGINIEVTYSLTIFRDRTALSNKERTGTVTATVTF